MILIDVWAYLFAPTDGLLNAILQHLHLPQPLWLGDPNIALLSILLVGFPWVSGVGFLIFLGGLQNLPRETLEASALDGVGSLRRIFAIDAPLVLPQFRVVVVLSGIAAIRILYPILLLTNGGPFEFYDGARSGYVPVCFRIGPIRIWNGHRNSSLHRDVYLCDRRAPGPQART